MRKIAESTVRRLSLYLRFLEEFEEQGVDTVSSEALATRGGTTSAQVRKDLFVFRILRQTRAGIFGARACLATQGHSGTLAKRIEWP